MFLLFLLINFPSEEGGSGGGGNEVGSVKGRGKKRTADSGLKDFAIEYAKSNRSTCKGCEEKIMKVSWEQQLLLSSICKCYFVVNSSLCVSCFNVVIWLTQFDLYTHLFQCLLSVDVTPNNK